MTQKEISEATGIKTGGTLTKLLDNLRGELDDNCIDGAVRAIENAVTLIIGGTSLVVYPAAGLIQYFHGKKLVLINKSETSADRSADLVIRESIGKVLKEAVEKMEEL